MQEELRRAYQGLSGSGSDDSEAQVCKAELAKNTCAGTTVAEERSRKLKTKNKVAQKRYRRALSFCGRGTDITAVV